MNLVEYVWSQRTSFDAEPLGEVDAAVLSQLCMLELEQLGEEPWKMEAQVHRPAWMAGRLRNAFATKVLRRAAGSADEREFLRKACALHELWRAEYLDRMVASLIPQNLYELLGACAASPRFRDLKLYALEAKYSEAEHVQFGAICFVYEGENPWTAACFRGTNTSLVGWQENFDMAITPPVAGQMLAARYLARAAEHVPEDHELYAVGHSKGGNLATFAALALPEIEPRIARVYDFDGPGFKPGFFSAGQFEKWEGKLCRMVPQASLVGMLLETPVKTQVVEATGADISQHSPFTWSVEFDHDLRVGATFKRCEQLSPQARISHRVFADWLASLDPDQLPRIFDALFAALEAAGIRDASEIFAHARAAETLQKLRAAARDAEPEDREALLGALSQLTQLFVVHGLNFALGRRADAAASPAPQESGAE